jgi:hypothetical protein
MQASLGTLKEYAFFLEEINVDNNSRSVCYYIRRANKKQTSKHSSYVNVESSLDPTLPVTGIIS